MALFQNALELLTNLYPFTQTLHKLYYCRGRKSVRNLLWELSHSMPWFLQIQHFVKLPVDTDREQIQFGKKCQEDPEPTEWRLWETEVVGSTYVHIAVIR